MVGDKRIVSIGPGSSGRDHRVETELLGQRIVLERIGTDGDLDRVHQLMCELDGQVDAFGLANMDLHLQAGGRTYAVRDAMRVVRGVTRTPVVDGAGLKASWERFLVTEYLPAHGFDLRGTRVLVVSSVDRYALAEAFVDAGADVILGDAIFSVGLPVPFRSLRTVRLLAGLVVPVVTRLPFKYFYPVGDKQDTIVPRHERFYRWAEVVAGDFHYIRRHMPDDLTGKIILTQSITQQDLVELKQRGVRWLITDFPRMEGRSFATNVMQAAIVAILERPPDQIRPHEYVQTLLRAGVAPSIEELASSGSAAQASHVLLPRRAPATVVGAVVGAVRVVCGRLCTRGGVRALSGAVRVVCGRLCTRGGGRRWGRGFNGERRARLAPWSAGIVTPVLIPTRRPTAGSHTSIRRRDRQELHMTWNRPSMRTTTSFSSPFMPFVDVSAAIRATNDLMAHAGRMWIDLWFANLNRASAAFWEDVRTR